MPRFIIASHDVLQTVLEVCQNRNMPADRVLVLDDDVAKLLEYEMLPEIDSSSRSNDSDISVMGNVSDLLHHGESSWATLSSKKTMKATPAAY